MEVQSNVKKLPAKPGINSFQWVSPFEPTPTSRNVLHAASYQKTTPGWSTWERANPLLMLSQPFVFLFGLLKDFLFEKIPAQHPISGAPARRSEKAFNSQPTIAILNPKREPVLDDTIIARGALNFAGGALQNSNVLDAIIRVLNNDVEPQEQATRLETLAIIFKNALDYKYLPELTKFIERDCQYRQGGPGFLKKKNLPETLALVEERLAEKSVKFSAVIQSSEAGKGPVGISITMTEKRIIVDERFSEEIGDTLVDLPRDIFEGLIGQYHAQEPLPYAFTPENAEQFRKVFSAPGNHAYKREIFEKAIFEKKLEYLAGHFRVMTTILDLSHVDLSNLNLTVPRRDGSGSYGMNFTGANLTETYLTHSNLSGFVLNHAVLTGAILTGANLENAEMRYVKLDGQFLTNTNLTKVSLIGTTFTGKFYGTVISKFDSTILIDADLTKVKKEKSYSHDLPFTFRSASLQRTYLPSFAAKGNFEWPSFAAKGNVEWIDFCHAHLTDMNFSGMKLYVDLSYATLLRVNLSGTEFDRTSTMECAKLTNVNLAGSQLDSVSFVGAKLINTDIFAAQSRDGIKIDARTLESFPGKRNFYNRYALKQGANFYKDPSQRR